MDKIFIEIHFCGVLSFGAFYRTKVIVRHYKLNYFPSLASKAQFNRKQW